MVSHHLFITLDRLESDIVFGNQGGIQTLLVLTGKADSQMCCMVMQGQCCAIRSGVSQVADIEKQGIVPSYVAESLSALKLLHSE